MFNRNSRLSTRFARASFFLHHHRFFFLQMHVASATPRTSSVCKTKRRFVCERSPPSFECSPPHFSLCSFNILQVAVARRQARRQRRASVVCSFCCRQFNEPRRRRSLNTFFCGRRSVKNRFIRLSPRLQNHDCFANNQMAKIFLLCCLLIFIRCYANAH